MTSLMHKNTPEQLNSKTTTTDRTGAVNQGNSNIQNLPVLDIEKEKGKSNNKKKNKNKRLASIS